MAYRVPGATVSIGGKKAFMIILCGFGVSNYHNKLKLLMLEKGIAFQERVVYPWQRE